MSASLPSSFQTQREWYCYLPWGTLQIESFSAEPLRWHWVSPSLTHKGLPGPLSAQESALAQALEAYGAGDPDPLLAWKLPEALLNQYTPFQQWVWHALCTIPWGAVESYGSVAQQVGARLNRSSAPRAVGQACRLNPWPLRVPCHRVVAAGAWVGYAGHTQGWLPQLKQTLLAFEQEVSFPNLADSHEFVTLRNDANRLIGAL